MIHWHDSIQPKKIHLVNTKILPSPESEHFLTKTKGLSLIYYSYSNKMNFIDYDDMTYMMICEILFNNGINMTFLCIMHNENSANLITR